MTKPEILMTAELAQFPYPAFDRDFTVHRLWTLDNPDQFLRDHGGRIRGMVAAGKRRIDGALLDRMPSLEVIANIGVGYDRLDIEAVAARDIIATNTPDVLTEEVADLTVGLLVATVRRLPQAERHLRAGLWPKGSFPNSPSLRGRRVGIVGLGRIGKAVARRLEAFGLDIAYHGRSRQAAVPYRYYADLVEMARDVTVLILVVPGTSETDGMVDARVLDALGSQGVLINVARGSVVDEDAMIAALRDRRILAAGLDVFLHEPHVPESLLKLDNVVLLPHVGSASIDTRMAMIELIRDNLLSWFAGRGPLTPVAETPWDSSTPRKRIVGTSKS